MNKIKVKRLQEPAEEPAHTLAGGEAVGVATSVTPAKAVTEKEKKPGQKKKS